MGKDVDAIVQFVYRNTINRSLQANCTLLEEKLSVPTHRLVIHVGDREDGTGEMPALYKEHVSTSLNFDLPQDWKFYHFEGDVA